MPEVGMDGQRKLKTGSVLCIGAGGSDSRGDVSGCCRLGRLGIVDFDVVDFSNLQRQLLPRTTDVGRTKLDVGEGRDRCAESARPGRHLRRGTVVENALRAASSATT
jgi:adenylyltransferase/sulfurtransferase